MNRILIFYFSIFVIEAISVSGVEIADRHFQRISKEFKTKNEEVQAMSLMFGRHRKFININSFAGNLSGRISPPLRPNVPSERGRGEDLQRIPIRNDAGLGWKARVPSPQIHAPQKLEVTFTRSHFSYNQ